jgi:hypothetical protein
MLQAIEEASATDEASAIDAAMHKDFTAECVP